MKSNKKITQNREKVDANNLLNSLTPKNSNKYLIEKRNWNPPFCGEIDMKICRDGTWLYNGTPIGRPELVKLFSNILIKENNKYFLITPVEKVGIIVDDAPFIAVDFSVNTIEEGKPSLCFETNVGDKVLLSNSNPILLTFHEKTQEPSPYITVRDNLKALIDRKSFYRLVDLGSHKLYEGQHWFGISSGGSFFPFVKSSELY